MKVAVIGSGGQLGTELRKALESWTVFPFTRQELDICDFVYTEEVLTALGPDVVINTAAFNRVDDCEDEPSRAFWVNAFAVRKLAQLCSQLNCTLVHISTDYVFDGERDTPYTEEDSPNPVNVYGASKLTGEYFSRNICRKHLVIRTSGVFGAAGSRAKGGNFVETMITLARQGKCIRVVDDQVLSPTYAKDLAHAIGELLRVGALGIFHVTNSGRCSWYQLAAKVMELTGLAADLEPVTSQQFGAKARRPRYSVLANHGIRRLGIPELRPWTDALQAYLLERGHLLAT
jgi:dTDP-4-dehydrorhamnose reductase